MILDSPLAHDRFRWVTVLRSLVAVLLVSGAFALVRATPGSAATLTVPVWTVSSDVAAAQNVAYTYSFTTASANNLSSITMTVPTGTSGTPSLGTVTAYQSYVVSSSMGGSIALAGNLLTLTFASSTYVPASTTVTIPVRGLTNTSTVGDYSATITTNSGPPTTPVDTGTTSTVAVATNSLGDASWSTSNPLVGATSASYTYGAVTSDTATLTSISMSVPPNTTGGSLLVSSTSGVPSNGTVSLASGILKYSFTGTSIGSGTAISIRIGGITNTAAVQSYTPQIVTATSAGPDSAGYAESISFTQSALTNSSWSMSNAASGATGVTYTFKTTTTTSDSFTSLTMTVPPGTGGTPSLGTVTMSNSGNAIQPPSSPSIALTGGELIYTFATVYINSGTTLIIPVTGLTNTAASGSYTSQITTFGWSSTPPPSFPIDAAVTSAVAVTGGTLSSPIWNVSNAASGATGVTYTYTFTTASTANLTSVTMTVPPGTAAVALGVGTVSGVPSNGTSTLSSGTLTYAFTSTAVAASTHVSIQFTGLTNTATTGSYTSQVTTQSSAGPIDSGLTAAVAIAGGALVNPIWNVSNAVAGATGVTYTYTFTAASSATLTSLTMTVPPNTGGTPALGAVSGVPANGTITLGSNMITYAYSGTWLAQGAAVSIKFTGLTNTATPGSYTSQITTNTATTAQDTGNSAAISITGGAVNAATSTISASPTSITADGVTTSTITVTLLDVNGNPVAGKTVTLSQGAGSSVIGAASGTSSSLGVVTFSVTDTTAQSVTYGATDSTDSLTLTHTVAVRFTSGPPSAATSTISASPSSITANGIATSTITVTLDDAHNNPLITGGATVVISSSLGTLSAVTDHNNGTYSATLTSPTTAGSATISATLAGVALTHQTSVTFTSQPSPVFQSPPPVQPMVGGTYTLVVTALGNPPLAVVSATPMVCSLAGLTVTFVRSGDCAVVAAIAGVASAPSSVLTFWVVPATQTITFTTSPGTSVVGGTYTVGATTTSGNPPVFSSDSPLICTVEHTTVTFDEAGTCVISATIAVSETFAAATNTQLVQVVSSPSATPSGVITVPGALQELSPGLVQVVTASGVALTATVAIRANSIVVTSGEVSMSVVGDGIVSPTGAPTVSVTSGVASVFAGSGFVPGTRVQIYAFSRAILIGTAVVQANGTYSRSLLVPSSLSAGNHTIRAQGLAKSGGLLVMSVGVVVARTVTNSYALTQFPRASYRLSAAMIDAISRWARLLKTKNGVRITIEGFSSGLEWPVASDLISRQRATVVKNTLMAEFRRLGVKQAITVGTIAMGARQLVASNATPWGQGANRRVLLLMTYRTSQA